jgi:hypothetical protein
MFKHPSYTSILLQAHLSELAEAIVRMKAPGWQNNYLEHRDRALLLSAHFKTQHIPLRLKFSLCAFARKAGQFTQRRKELTLKVTCALK